MLSLRSATYRSYRQASKTGKGYYQPHHPLANNLAFDCESGDEESENEASINANLADAIAQCAAINGLTGNDVMHIIPLVLRMLKSKSEWAT